MDTPVPSDEGAGVGQAGVETPWSHQHKGKKGWQMTHRNTQGLNGQTSWEHKGAKRGTGEGEPRTNPWKGLANHDGSDQKQSY